MLFFFPSFVAFFTLPCCKLLKILKRLSTFFSLVLADQNNFSIKVFVVVFVVEVNWFIVLWIKGMWLPCISVLFLVFSKQLWGHFHIVFFKNCYDFLVAIQFHAKINLESPFCCSIIHLALVHLSMSTKVCLVYKGFITILSEEMNLNSHSTCAQRCLWSPLQCIWLHHQQLYFEGINAFHMRT